MHKIKRYFDGKQNWALVVYCSILAALLLPSTTYAREQERPQGLIAFTAGVANGIDMHIYLYDPQTGVVRRITEERTGRFIDKLSWSPDGKYLAFGMWMNPLPDSGIGKYDIYVWEVGTATYRRLTLDQKSKLPTWSPDGKRIAYLSRDANGLAIYTINLDGTHNELLFRLPTLSYINLEWSPDGKQLALSFDRSAYCPQLSVVDLPTKIQKEITTASDCVLGQFSWSSDGQSIIASRQNSKNYLIRCQIIRADGSMIQEIKHAAPFEGCPIVSPDGKYFAFTAQYGDTPFYAIDLFITKSDGTAVQQVTHYADPNFIGAVAWQPIPDRR